MQPDHFPNQPTPLVLLIDGNNLAHHLYSHLGPRQKMTPADSRRLIAHLASYALNYQAALQIELCLDRSPQDFDLPPDNLLVMHADYPHTGDGLLLSRFWYHHLGGHACLVVTNDEVILDEVAQAQGMALRVYDFVRRVGLVSPVFRAPDELPPVMPRCIGPTETGQPRALPLALSASVYFRIIEDNRQRSASKTVQPQTYDPRANTSQPVKPNRHSTTQPAPMQADRREGATQEVETQGVAALEGAAILSQADLPADRGQWPEPAAAPDPAAVETNALAGPTEGEAGPYYFLSLENWPVNEGVHFLLHAFCSRHQAEYRDLVQSFDTDDLRPADLRALAELLLHACGSEPDFAQRGALMTRVRLALLQAGGEPLSLKEIARRTGLKPLGLQGRIKEKAGRWVEILSL